MAGTGKIAQKPGNEEYQLAGLASAPATQASKSIGFTPASLAAKKEEVMKKLEEAKRNTLMKQEKMRFLKAFLDYKRKIYQLISLGKPEEAKSTYDNLYLLYQQITKQIPETELASIKTEISIVYHNLEQAINKKKIKKGHFTEVDTIKRSDDRIFRTKIVTTDLDQIMQIVEERGKLSLGEIEAKFNIPRRLAEEWVQILADYGLVEIKYLAIGGLEITKPK